MLCKERLLYRQSQPSFPHSAPDTLRMCPPRGASAPRTRYFLPRSTGTPTLPSPPIQLLITRHRSHQRGESILGRRP